MNNYRKLKRIAKKTLKYIKYLQTNGLEALQDENGNITEIRNYRYWTYKQISGDSIEESTNRSGSPKIHFQIETHGNLYFMGFCLK